MENHWLGAKGLRNYKDVTLKLKGACDGGTFGEFLDSLSVEEMQYLRHLQVYGCEYGVDQEDILEFTLDRPCNLPRYSGVV